MKIFVKIKTAKELCAKHSALIKQELFGDSGQRVNNGWIGVHNFFRPEDKNLSSSAFFDDGCFYDFVSGKMYDMIDYYMLVGKAKNKREASELLIKQYNGCAETPIFDRPKNKKHTPVRTGSSYTKNKKYVQVIPAPKIESHTEKDFYDRSVINKFEVRYTYRTCDGKIWGYVDRYRSFFANTGEPVLNSKDKPVKLFYPLIRVRDVNTGEEQWKRGKIEPFPLYNLDQILFFNSAKILIVSGEKCADAANFLFDKVLNKNWLDATWHSWVATTWQGGDKVVHKIDFSPLKGRTVLCWPDNDDSGIEAMNRIKSILPQSVVLPVSRKKPKGWDICDALDAGWQPDVILKYIDAYARGSVGV